MADTVYYPRLLWRLKAVMIDSIVVPLAMIASLLVGVELGVTDPIIRIALLVGPLFLLEPLMVTATGGTIGHHLLRLRVMRQDGDGNLNIFAATLRFVIKALTGWFSFILVLTSRKHQALHDILSRSIVVHRDAARVPTHEALAERQVEDGAFVYPPVWRRVLVIFAYCLLVFVIVEIAVAASVSYPCLEYKHCGDKDRVALFTLDVFWLAGTSISVVLGWKSRLFGARRRAQQ
ncbi:MAG TPA: RDD family protein [Gammaproteobacteria bacterium]